MSGTEGVLGRARTAASRYRRPLAAVLAVVVVALPLFLTTSLLGEVSLVLVFAMLAFAAIAPIGYAGQLILSQGAFFGIGAYTFVKTTGAGVPPVLSVGLAILLTAVVAYVLGWPATRARGIYLGIITLAFNELFVISLDLFPDFTGGSTGISSPDLFPEGLTAVVGADLLYYYVLLVAFVLVYLGFRRVLDSEIGWAFRAVQEDPTVAESIGVDAQRYRLLAFTLAGAVCGLAGGLYAPMAGYLSPTLFDLHTSIDVILAGMVGGLAVPLGSVLGGAVVVLVPTILRGFSEYRLAVFGTLLILLIVFVPQGIGGWLRDWLG
jgi:branched-chain amino acid transport system permease protein